MINFYEQFLAEHSHDYNTELRTCIEETVKKLAENETDVTKPGMLLGKIQSGKTRTFIGIMALAFDRGYDMVIILTKGTKVLTEQTYQRLDKVFEKFIESDSLRLYNIMATPEELTTYIRSKKLIFVAKKQKDNLNRIVDLFTKYEDFGRK
jgi:RecG-like helicase